MTTELFTGPVAQAIGWALLHALWQGTIVAAMLAAILAVAAKRSATIRYAASCAALAVVLVLGIATAFQAYEPVVVREAESANSITLPLTSPGAVVAAVARATWRARAETLGALAERMLPGLVAIWFAGVVLLSTRLLLTWQRAQRLVSSGSRSASERWQETAARLAAALGLRRAVRLIESAAVEVPSVIGVLRPVIVLPASTLTGLTPEQIEMVLAHELAHIRRHDFLVNLLQAVVETLMFYHPAVWWISQRVRVERENCCDDLAVAVCGNPLQYARALARLEELRADVPALAVAANGGSLLERIRRIAASHGASEATGPRWAAAVALLTVLALALAVPSLPALAQRERKEPPPKAAASRIDVTAPRTLIIDEDAVDDLEDESENEIIDIDVDVDADEDVDVDVDEDIDVDVDVDEDIDVDVVVDVDEDIDVDVDVDEDDEVRAPAPPPAPPSARSATPARAPRALRTPSPTPVVTPATPRPIAPAATPTPVVTPVPLGGATAPAAPARLARVRSIDLDADDDDRSAKRTDGKLTVEELVALRVHNITAADIDAMRALFPAATISDITSLSVLGTTPAMVRELRAAGIEIRSTSDAAGLAALGVTASYVREMRDAGVAVKSAAEAQSLRALGVSPRFVRRLAAAGYRNLSVAQLSNLAAAGVNDDFIREMSKYREQ